MGEMIRQRIQRAMSSILAPKLSPRKREFTSHRERSDSRNSYHSRKGDSDRHHRERHGFGYGGRDFKRPHEQYQRRSSRSRDFSGGKERFLSHSIRGRSPSHKRPHRDYAQSNSFINQDDMKSFPTAELPVVFID